MKDTTIIIIAGLNGLVATAFAALGSHALPISNADIGLFETAYTFHYVHTLAMIACASISRTEAPRWSARAFIFFFVGSICFSGSLYWRATMGPGSLGLYHWVTPLGGLALMGGWITLSVAGWSSRKLAK